MRLRRNRVPAVCMLLDLEGAAVWDLAAIACLLKEAALLCVRFRSALENQLA